MDKLDNYRSDIYRHPTGVEILTCYDEDDKVIMATWEKVPNTQDARDAQLLLLAEFESRWPASSWWEGLRKGVIGFDVGSQGNG